METKDLFEYDSKYFPLTVAGVDEAGRGPLAGPVVAAACIMPRDCFIDGVNDSKKLTAKQREHLYGEIVKTALDYCIIEVDNRLIDIINILQATKLAMKNALNGLKRVRPDIVLVDAVTALDVPYRCEAIIKGDAQSYSIAAASVLAKVHRDRLMLEYDLQFPRYGFASNKGYGTAVHIGALKAFGKCDIHRDTFIKNFVSAHGADTDESAG